MNWQEIVSEQVQVHKVQSDAFFDVFIKHMMYFVQRCFDVNKSTGRQIKLCLGYESLGFK